MKQFFRSIFPVEFFADSVYFRALLLGVIYLVSFLAQLFSFEKFDGVVGAYLLPGGAFTAAITVWLLPLTALMALPFLMSMRGLGRRVRSISRTAVVALPLFWLTIGLWLAIINGTPVNTGLFGATIAVQAGAWLVVFALLWLWAALQLVRELPERK